MFVSACGLDCQSLAETKRRAPRPVIRGLVSRRLPVYHPRMKSFKLLMDADFRDSIEAMCAVLGAEASVVDSEPVRRSQNLRLYQIDLPDLPARVVAETARQTGVSTGTLLLDWIAQCAEESSGGGTGEPRRILAKCRRIADWCGLGYTDEADAIAALAARLTKD